MTPERDADAFTRGLAALRRRERTVSELHEWLTARGFEVAEVEVAITRLIELGELDDHRFACRFAEDKRELSGWGPERIREVLLDRGVEPAFVDEALSADPAEEQLDRAVSLLRDRGRSLGDNREREKALMFLARRGYDLDLAHEALRRYAREAADRERDHRRAA